MRAVNLAAVKADLTQRDWVIKVLAEAANAKTKAKDLGSVHARRDVCSEGNGRGAAVASERDGETRNQPEANGRSVARQEEPEAAVKELARAVERTFEHSAKTCRVYGCLMCAAQKEAK